MRRRAITIGTSQSSHLDKWVVHKLEAGQSSLVSTLPVSAVTEVEVDTPGIYVVRGMDAANVMGNPINVRVN